MLHVLMIRCRLALCDWWNLLNVYSFQSIIFWSSSEAMMSIVVPRYCICRCFAFQACRWNRGNQNALEGCYCFAWYDARCSWRELPVDWDDLRPCKIKGTDDEARTGKACRRAYGLGWQFLQCLFVVFGIVACLSVLIFNLFGWSSLSRLYLLKSICGS